MRIGIIHIYQFPQGMAPTVRISSYCKGLVERGHDCDIISIVPKKGREPLSAKMEYGTYHYFSYHTKSLNPIVRSIDYRIKKWKCRFSAVRYIKQQHKKCPYDCLIVSCDALLELYSTIPFLHGLSTKIVMIADEYPYPIRIKLKKSLSKFRILNYKILNRFVDGRILMTEKLKTFFDEKITPKPSVIVSTIVNTDKFIKAPYIPKNNDEYLCYMGNMELAKDNIDNIIRAFDLIKNKYTKLKLFLFGAPSKKDRTFLENLISSLGLCNRVIIKGRVSFDQVPSILKSAKILVASQPNTKRAEGGFPTKMGEYFMTGVPTILTDVGEIHKYVKDNVNAFLVEPENPQRYAEKLCYILDNYHLATETAKKATEMILSNFSCESAAICIESFIQHIKDE